MRPPISRSTCGDVIGKRLSARLTLTRNQILGFWAAWSGWLLDGMDSVIYALVLAPALTELLPKSGIGATTAHVGFAGSILFAVFLIHERQALHSFHPRLPPSSVWGYNGMVPGPTFLGRSGTPFLVRFVNDLRVITSAVSLGHDETLIAYEQYPEDRAAAFDARFRKHGLIRLAVGLESAQDLITDLDAALTTVYGAHQ